MGSERSEGKAVGRDVGSRWMAEGCGKAGDVRKIERIQITRCVEGDGEQSWRRRR